MASPLESLLIPHLAEHGAISVADYMGTALLHPEHGYYTTKEPFGTSGDFTTAPEISQLFGEMVGAWIAGVWQSLNSPSPKGERELNTLLELGPGRGTLMVDMLRATRHAPGFHEAIAVHLVEASPRLQQIQQETLKDAHPRLHWREDMNALPPQPTFIVANEFFDALPVSQYLFTGGVWHERLVGVENDALAFTLSDPLPEGALDISAYPPPEEGDILEASPMALHMMHQLCMQLLMCNGAMLVVDYGYTQPAYGDTLQAVKSHHYHPVLETPGEADLTAHVDFAALADVARASGCKVFGAVSQGDFLRRLGIELRASALCRNASIQQAESILSGLERLVSPTQMGELFKVMAITAPYIERVEGFD